MEKTTYLRIFTAWHFTLFRHVMMHHRHDSEYATGKSNKLNALELETAWQTAYLRETPPGHTCRSDIGAPGPTCRWPNYPRCPETQNRTTVHYPSVTLLVNLQTERSEHVQ